MTSYNREPYIAEAIESVLAQTLADFELVVCDDASADRTAAIAESYARRDPRVVVLRHDANVGDYANRNRAAAAARGRYLKYHDSDDLMYPHCLSVMAGALDGERRAGIAFSSGRYWPGGPCPMLLTPKLAYEREFLGGGLFHIGPGGAMFRTDVFRALGGFPMAGAASDYVLWVHACARVPVLLVPGDLFYYRMHPGQELASAKSAFDYARGAGVAWAMLNSAECPLDSVAREQAKRNHAFTAARGAFRHARRGRFREAAAVVRDAGLHPFDWIHYLRPPRRIVSAGTPSPAPTSSEVHAS
jgi:glycosyltransferase involved in cell wall biosynthesis